MSDRELLELAAKASGIKFRWNEPCGKIENLSDEGWHLGFFEPLTEYGDAMRLAVKLGLVIDTAKCRAIKSDRLAAGHRDWTYSGDDELLDGVATRRAIVRAAAAIGSKL